MGSMTDGELLASLVLGAISEHGTSKVHLDRVAKKWADQVGSQRPGVLLEAQTILQHGSGDLDAGIRWAAVAVVRKARHLAAERTNLSEERRLLEEFAALERGGSDDGHHLGPV